MRCLLISRLPGETRAALLDGDLLTDLLIDRDDRPSLVGSIYKGRVATRAPGTGGAFVDIGGPQAAFLPLRKSDRVSDGQAITVQVNRDADGQKGPRLTLSPSLPGRTLILVTDKAEARVSRRLGAKDRRSELLAWAGEKVGNGVGVVLRRTAEEAEPAVLEREWTALKEDWRAVVAAAGAAAAPSCLRAPPDAARTLLSEAGHLDEVVVDDSALLAELGAWAARRGPDLRTRMGPHPGPRLLFDAADIETEVASLAEPLIPLPSGGRLIVETTAALTVFDVDGGSTPGGGRGGAAHRTNMEAAAAVARHLRLRNIGGAVAVDFIPGVGSAQSRELIQTLRDAVAEDPVPVQVLGRGPIGLVEMIREHRRRPLADLLVRGAPPLPDPVAAGFEAVRTVLREAAVPPHGPLILDAAPAVAEALSGPVRAAFDLAKRRLGRPLTLRPDPGQSPGGITLRPDSGDRLP